MTARLPITVRYAETDAMGVVHHAVYPVWLEAVRVQWMDEIGLPYAQVEQQGINFSVIELFVRYRSPVRFGQVILVEASLTKLTTRSARFDYLVFSEDVLCAEGHTRHLATDRSGKVIRLPEAVYQKFLPHVQSR